MKRRTIANLVLAGCIAAVACVDLSAPAGPSAISELVLPAGFVVVGDSMRDSTGRALPPTVLAFDQQGRSTPATGVSFFITDSVRYARFDSVTHIIIGDSLGLAHALAQIGNLQTGVQPVWVTVQPRAIQQQAPADTDTLAAPIGADSATSRKAITTKLRVSGGTNAPSPALADTAVPGFRVSYQLLYAPASRGASPAVFLADQSGNPSLGDTTDQSGIATHQVVVIGAFLRDLSNIAAGRQPESVVVQANAIYRNSPLKNAPLKIVIPLSATFNVK